MYITRQYWKKNVSAILGSLLLVWGGAPAADAAGPVEINGHYEISQDMEIAIDGTTPNKTAFYHMSDDESVAVAEGVSPKLTIVCVGPNDALIGAHGLASMSNTEYDLRGLSALDIHGPFSNAVLAAGGRIYLGDNVSIDLSMITNSEQDDGIEATMPVTTPGAADEFSDVRIGDNLSLKAHGHGVESLNGSSVVIGDGAYIYSQLGGGITTAFGKESDGKKTEITVGDSLDIDSEHHGVSASDYSKITVGDDARISSRSQVGAIAFDEGAQVEIGSRAAITGADGGAGVQGGGDMTIGGDAVIRSGAEGVFAFESGSELTIGDRAEITAEKNALDAEDGSRISVGDDLKVLSSSGAGVYALYPGTEVTIGKGASVDVSQIALYAGGEAQITVDDDAVLTARDAGASTVTAVYGGQVEMGNATILTQGTGNDLAFYAAGGNPNYPTSTIKADGVYNVDGSLYAVDDAKIDLAMQSGSKLRGYSLVSGDKAAIDVSMDKSQWEMTSSSTLTDLALSGGSNVHFGEYSRPADDTFMKLTTDKLSGSGVFDMQSDIAIEMADQLIVTDTTAGDHILSVANSGSAETTGKERTILVETADRGGNFTLQNGTVDAGAWKYALRNVSDDERGQLYSTGGEAGQLWELYAQGPSGPGEGGTDTFMGTYYLNYAETDTLMKRLGDLRGDAEHGAWFRGFGGNMDSEAREFAGAFDMDYWGMQVGYDNKLDRANSWFKNGDTYVGGFIGVSNGDLDFAQESGTGDLENHTMGMYATYIGDKGYYFDAIAKYVWSKNEFTAHDSAGSLVQGGKINTGGVGLSLEMGKRIRFNNESKRDGNWYVEPQVQLSWQHMGGDTFHASNGLDIGVDDFNSLIGRVGALVGYESKDTNIYVKASYLKEFDGDMDVHGNDSVMADSLEGDWWVYGLGITRKLNERNALYLDLERASGDDFDQDWNVNAGWRLLF